MRVFYMQDGAVSAKAIDRAVRGAVVYDKDFIWCFRVYFYTIDTGSEMIVLDEQSIDKLIDNMEK